MIAYRLLTGPDDASFCHKVTEALARGWALHGSPCYVADPFNTGQLRCAQAVTKEIEGDYDPDVRLGSL